jgi:hypothetical protein
MMFVAVGFLLGAETVLSAGVVMSEIAISKGPIENGNGAPNRLPPGQQTEDRYA